MSLSTHNKKQVDQKVASRWTHQQLFDNGYVGVPTSFLQLYSKLTPPLTTGEALFVIHLMSYKWTEKDPFPSYKSIADKMDVTTKAVQRYAASLESKRYLVRVPRVGSSNEFDLSKLFDALLLKYRTAEWKPKTKGVRKNV
jgi:hypothetical protein